MRFFGPGFLNISGLKGAKTVCLKGILFYFFLGQWIKFWCILHILRIRIRFFCVFSVKIKSNSSFSQYTHNCITRIIHIRIFCTFSVYVKFLSQYSYSYNLIPHILMYSTMKVIKGIPTSDQVFTTYNTHVLLYLWCCITPTNHIHGLNM